MEKHQKKVAFYMMIFKKKIVLGYDYDTFLNCKEKIGIMACCEKTENSHIILSGMSGSGKSTALLMLYAELIKTEENGIYYFADFKQDSSFRFLRKSKRYYPFEKCLEAIEIVYEILLNRQLGKNESEKPVTLIFDEYVSYILYLMEIDKRKADSVMSKIATILMLGRSLKVRLILTCQRPDANVFKNGSRLNFGIIIILGASIKSIYEMFLPKEYIELIGDRKFKVGEGVVLLQNSELHFVKMPIIRNEDKLKELCMVGLSE